MDMIIELLTPLIIFLAPLAVNWLQTNVKIPARLVPVVAALLAALAEYLGDLLLGGEIKGALYIAVGLTTIGVREVLKHWPMIGKLFMGPPSRGGAREAAGRLND